MFTYFEFIRQPKIGEPDERGRPTTISPPVGSYMALYSDRYELVTPYAVVRLDNDVVFPTDAVVRKEL